jgi:hypothetical protein
MTQTRINSFDLKIANSITELCSNIHIKIKTHIIGQCDSIS